MRTIITTVGTSLLTNFQKDSRGNHPTDQALANYLSLLGWSSPNEGQEIMSLEEITTLFDLSRVQKNPAIFDIAKLSWMNRTYINKTPGDALVDIAQGFFADAGLVPPQLDPQMRSWLAQVIDLLKTHVDHLDQLPNETGIIYGMDANLAAVEPGVLELLKKPEGQAVAGEFARLVEERETLTAESYRTILGEVKAATHQKGRNLYHPIRAALTGRDSGPDLEKLIPLYEEGSRLNLPRKVMSCRERLRVILNAVAGPR